MPPVLPRSSFRAKNAQLDAEQQALSRDAALAAREQEERLASMPVNVDTFRASKDLRRSEAATAAATVSSGLVAESYEQEAHTRPSLEVASASFAALGLEAASIQDYASEYPQYVEDAPQQPVEGPVASARATAASASPPRDAAIDSAASASAARASAAQGRPSSASGRGGGGVGSGGGGGPASVPDDEGMGGEAALRYQKAKLAVTLEELERLRAVLAEKASAVASAEASVRDLQQKVGLASRSERSLQAALEREKSQNAEGAKRAAALERELSLLRKTDAEAAKREKSIAGDQRSKDVRLNRALEELERTKAQLKQLRDDKEGSGQGARAEAARLAAENTRLRKRQSELILAFKKQAKLIDVLKRQKLHVEAATMLSFTEEEFSKTLELGEALALA